MDSPHSSIVLNFLTFRRGVYSRGRLYHFVEFVPKLPKEIGPILGTLAKFLPNLFSKGLESMLNQSQLHTNVLKI